MEPEAKFKAVQDGSLRLCKRGPHPNWYARGTVRGETVFVSTGTADRARAALVVKEIFAHYLKPKEHRYTFAEACASYVIFGGETKYLPKLIARLGKMALADIKQTNLDEAARTLFGHTTRETQNRQAYTPFISVWNYAVGNEWADARTWRRPRKPRGTAVRKQATRSGTRPVSYERAWQFVSMMSPAPAMLMTALFYTGLRPIEAFALECEDVNIDGRWIVVRSSKTGEPRGVPMHEVLVPMLTALKQQGGKVFRTMRGTPYPLTSDNVKAQLGSAISGARGRLSSQGITIDDVSPYTARHTVSTQLVIAGVHPHIKDQILGHSVDSMSRHYTQVPQAPLIEVINRLPIVDAWQNAKWMADPLAWQSKLLRLENRGRAGRAG